VFTDRPDVPKWQQLSELLRRRIEAGEYQSRHAIPSEHALVTETGLARSTVRKAIAALKEDGWVYSVHGLGVFVMPPESRN
jgi:GntR family transcriptional regulator